MGLYALAQHRSLKSQMLLNTYLTSMTNVALSLQTISFLGKSYYIDCLKELSIDN